MYSKIDATLIEENIELKEEIFEAQQLISSCVHCGFCNATCPTYQALGDERDGPRGRIYLIKQLLETGHVSKETQTHLDRCLSCRSCETTCPSGVQYARLADIGKKITEKKVKRKGIQLVVRWLLLNILPYRSRFALLLKIGNLFRPLLPNILKQKVPVMQTPIPWVQSKTCSRKMLILGGCAQSVATPNTNRVLSKILATFDIELIDPTNAGCCGAANYHSGDSEGGKNFMRRNIDAWWPEVNNGIEAIVISASGCGVTVKEYGEILQYDRKYADKAKRISSLAKDVSEVLIEEDLSQLNIKNESNTPTALHCPCTLTHGQQLDTTVRKILERAGVALTRTDNDHLCCGSAGTYSIFQPTLSQRLLKNKLDDLTIDSPEQIVTANVGCQLHLASQAKQPVKHWLELLEPS